MERQLDLFQQVLVSGSRLTVAPDDIEALIAEQRSKLRLERCDYIPLGAMLIKVRLFWEDWAESDELVLALERVPLQLAHLAQEHVGRGTRANVKVLPEPREWGGGELGGAVPGAPYIDRLLGSILEQPSIEPEAALQQAAIKRDSMNFHSALTPELSRAVGVGLNELLAVNQTVTGEKNGTVEQPGNVTERWDKNPHLVE